MSDVLQKSQRLTYSLSDVIYPQMGCRHATWKCLTTKVFSISYHSYYLLYLHLPSNMPSLCLTYKQFIVYTQ